MNLRTLLIEPMQSGTFARRLVLRFALVIAIMSLVVSAAFVSYSFIGDSTEKLKTATTTLNQVQELEATIWQLQLVAKEYTSARTEEHADALNAANKDVSDRARELKERPGLPQDERRIWQSVGESAAKATNSLLASDEGVTTAQAISDFDAAMEADVMAPTASARRDTQDRMQNEQDSQASTVTSSRAVLLAFVLGAALLSFIMTLFFTSTLMKGLGQLRKSTRAIVEGDFAMRFEYEGDDEIAEVAKDFNEMAVRLAAKEAHNKQLTEQLTAQVHDEKDKATLDPLTQLRNRRHFEEVLAGEMQRVGRTGSQFSIAIIDLDNFKQVNDRYGHDEGDAVLQRTSQTILQNLRPYDQACRLGGEEFGIIFPETTAQDAVVVMGRIMDHMANAGANGTRMTFSGGIAVYPTHAQSTADLYKHADEAAYVSKENGKAQVTIYNPAEIGNSDSADRRQQKSRGELDRAARTLVNIVDQQDPFSHHHSELTARYSAELARHLGLDEHTVKKVHLAALFHDVGKIAIPDEILNKPGRLTAEQYDEMKKHSEYGFLFLRNGMEDPIPTWVRHHHEHFDGSGYPDGLAGEAIPVGSRIILVADAFDAMTSDRVYRRAMTMHQALQELTANANRQFDPNVVQVMLQMASYGILDQVRAESGAPFVDDSTFQYGNQPQPQPVAQPQQQLQQPEQPQTQQPEQPQQPQQPAAQTGQQIAAAHQAQQQAQNVQAQQQQPQGWAEQQALQQAQQAANQRPDDPQQPTTPWAA